jgi:hypothetical protein
VVLFTVKIWGAEDLKVAVIDNTRVLRAILLVIAVCLISIPAYAKYSGGTGEPNDPYQIATAEDLIMLGETPEDYDKHFILTADIDLDPNLPGRKVFNRAAIAPDINDTDKWFQGTYFTGVFDGNGHTISHLTIVGVSYLGLFGQLESGAKISDLGLDAVDVIGTGDDVGGLVGYNNKGGIITMSYSTGKVTGDRGVGGIAGLSRGKIDTSYSAGMIGGESTVGGLVGNNLGRITTSYSVGTVSGDRHIGGLVGYNNKGGTITTSYSTDTITGNEDVGGLVGYNNKEGIITTSYSTGAVSGYTHVGGLVGYNSGGITTSYNAGTVSGESTIGGLVGHNSGGITASYSAGTVSGDEGVGGLVGYNSMEGIITTSYSTGMVTGNNDAGGLVGENWGNIATSYNTGAVSGNTHVGGLVGSGNPDRVSRSFWDIQTSGHTTSSGGTGLTTTEMQDINTYLNAGWDFVDEALNGTCDYWQLSPGDYPLLLYRFDYSLVMPEGFGTAQEPYLIRDAKDLGTVWYKPTAHYRLEAYVDLSEITWAIAVVPWFGGTFDGNGYVISNLHIQGSDHLGLLGRLNSGAIISNLGMEAVDVNGTGHYIGGLVGYNSNGIITTSYSTGTMTGNKDVGGLVGYNKGSIDTSYSTVAVTGSRYAGGLVGMNWSGSSIVTSYSTGKVSGNEDVGGLVGHNAKGGRAAGSGLITASFWDMETSGQSTSDGGTGKTTVEMQTASTFLEAGWDFVDETKNGVEDIWKITEGLSYPCLWWEPHKYSGGTGEINAPYLIYTAENLNAIGVEPNDWDKHFKLMADIDLSGYSYETALIAPDVDPCDLAFQGTSFTGIFDGNGYKISNLTIAGEHYLGLFGQLELGSEIKNLGVVDVNITGNDYLGGIVGFSKGNIANSYCTGNISGNRFVGGLTGRNWSAIKASYNAATVTGHDDVGGLAAGNYGSITNGYNTGVITANWDAGGLVGANNGSISTSYSTGTISGNNRAGGLVGYNNWDYGIITSSFWDVDTSGQSTSDGGTGKTTDEMQTASTFLDAGWDFMDETANGTEDIWWILEGQDYPRLWWEAYD